MQQPKIMMDVGIQREGYTFRLDPLSRVWLEEHYWDRPRVASVFIGFDQRQDFAQIPETIWRQVSHLLTGLSWEEINEIGGFVVVNPMTERAVFDSSPVHV